jgi:Ca2+-binding EF-hand superfamily protein
MKKAVLVAALLLSQISIVHAQAQSAALHQGHKDALDTNKNGTVERSEYQVYMQSAFTNLDKNKDGKLDKSEMGSVLTEAQFTATDANGNGSLSQTELMHRVMADFASADQDGDGKLQ